MEVNADPNNTTIAAIIDSSYLVAISNKKDASHKRAQILARKLLDSNTTLILPGEVFSETINALWRKVSKTTAVRAAKVIFSSNYVLPETENPIRLAALGRFEKLSNFVSFTDCLVMAFADNFKTKTILGFDEAFEKNGYSLP